MNRRPFPSRIANFLMGDGLVLFIRENIAASTYVVLRTSNGNEADAIA
jgi:hypothetical protein